MSADTSATPNTHTLYNYHARQLRQANEAIAQTRKYLEPDSPHYLPAYIEQLEQLKNTQQAPPDGIDEKIKTAQANFKAYTERAERAHQVIADYPAIIRELEADNNVYLAPPEKQDQYLYVLDEETCQASCIDWQAVAGNAGQAIQAETPNSYQFSDKQDIELTGPDQTDAVRVWNHNVCIKNLKIIDNRCYTDAHRDAIQLIPPPLHRFEEGVYIRMADQMAGAVLENVTIQGCEICAPHGPLQGIFASDGLHRKLSILNNDISTLGAHSISIAGLLSGGHIAGNTLREVKGGKAPQITLYPARIGGNMADDGVVSILSFKEPAAGAEDMAYKPVSTAGEPNRLIRADGSEETITVNDVRHMLPDNYLKLAIALQDFDFDAYLADYSSLTLGQYREYDPFGAEKMQEWLTRRTQEFAHGREAEHPLGQPSEEQKKIGTRFLAPALQAMQAGSAEDERVVDLEYTAIRSFVMKRLAIMRGTVDPLIDIALLNERRTQMLKYLLQPEQLNNLVRIAYIDAEVVCNGSGQPVPHLDYSLFFAPDKVYSGQTDAKGRINLTELPLGPYIMRLDNRAFCLATAACPVSNPADPGTERAGIVARSLLNDFRKKMPIVRAWLAQDAQNEVYGLSVMRRCLSALQVTPETELTDDLRRDCLTVLGLGNSHREPYRKDVTVYVHCPQTNKTATGCLGFLWGFFKKLLNR